MSAPLVKICGLTRVDEAVRAAELGADLIGLNFHPPSPRSLDPAAAREIAVAVRGRATVVGVFVDRGAEEIRSVDEAVGLDLVQLHGDEPDELVRSFGARALKVFRLSEGDPLPRLDRFPAAWGFLFDRAGDPRFGGTGERWAWERLSGLQSERPVLVAGGIGPGTAREALAASGARGIDVCSGVESSPGRKDPELLQRLFEEIRHGEAVRST